MAKTKIAQKIGVSKKTKAIDKSRDKKVLAQQKLTLKKGKKDQLR